MGKFKGIREAASFEQVLEELEARAPWTDFDRFTDLQLRQVLAKKTLHEEDLLALLSPAALPYLEEMAQKSRKISLQNFGRAVEIFTPLYLANICTNRCVYCGYNTNKNIPRLKLNMEDLESEAKAIRGTGLRNLLILTGDAPKITGVDYLEESTKILVKYFPSIGIEVPSMRVEEYSRLAKAGISSMTMFQETYNRELYSNLHPAGPKRDFLFRLNAPQRAVEGGIRAVNLGALLGLDDWRRDIFLTAMHAIFLQRKYPELPVSISLPRICPCGEKAESREEQAFEASPVADKSLVQALLAVRLFLPKAGITMSSREPARLREKLIPMGVTRISAGVSTGVGGHSVNLDHSESSAQFDISDSRSVAEISKSLENMGYQPVFTDWILAEGGNLALSGALKSLLGAPALT